MEENDAIINKLVDGYIMIDEKITGYDLLYKKWCKKTDNAIKNICIKIQNQHNIIQEYKNINDKTNNKINNLELKLHKSNKLIIFLVNRIKKSKKKSNFELFIYQLKNINKIYYISSLFLILFFIVIYYI